MTKKETWEPDRIATKRRVFLKERIGENRGKTEGVEGRLSPSSSPEVMRQVEREGQATRPAQGGDFTPPFALA